MPKTGGYPGPSCPPAGGREVATHYGVEMRNVLTGFKWIG